MAVVNPDARPADDLVRYREDIRDGIYDGMVADQSGEWVRHSDVATLLAANDAQIATLTAERDDQAQQREWTSQMADELATALRDARAETERLRRDLGALNAAAIAIVNEYGPPSEYDQPYRGMWLALQYAIREGA